MLSRQEDQAEREAVLRNDARVREQGSTYLAQTHSDVGGRFSAVGAQTVVGAEPFPRYPALPSGPWSGEDPCGTEPPLGYRIDAMPELETPTVVSSAPPVGQLGEPTRDAPSSTAPSVGDVEHALGSPPSNLASPVHTTSSHVAP